MSRLCNACNINVDKNNCLKERFASKTCYNKNRRKNNNNTTIENEICTSYQQPNVDKITNDKVNNPSVSIFEN